MQVGRVGGATPQLISVRWLDTASCRDDKDGNGDASPPLDDGEYAGEIWEERDDDSAVGGTLPSNDGGSSDTSIVGR